MSVVSAKQTSKPSSVVSAARSGIPNSGHSTSTTQRKTNGSESKKPFNALTIPNTVGKGRVLGDQEFTEEELDHLADVVRRHEMLLRKEDERLKQMREKAVTTEKARHGISRFDDAHCALCSATFISIINPKSLCNQCERNVCRNCVKTRFDVSNCLCKECYTECSNKAKTGLWFTEKLQLAKKEGRILPIAPTSALRASLIRKRREQSAASSVVGKPPTPQKSQNDSVADPVQEAALRLAKENGNMNGTYPINPHRPPNATAATSAAEQLAFNVIFSGVNDLPKTTPRSGSRQHSSSGYDTPLTVTGNPTSVSESNRDWDNRSMASAVSIGSVTSVYSEREESFTHGLRITGTLSFSVDYDDKTSTLRIFVKEAREIAAADTKANHSSTYVKTYLLPDKTKPSKRKTKVRKNTTNPVYNETLVYNISKADLAYRTLQLSVWHHRHAHANLFLGEVLVPLVDYRFSPTPVWRPLQNRNAVDSVSRPRLTQGQIRLGLKFQPNTQGDLGELHVYIKNATDLNVPLGATATTDPKNLVNAVVKTHLLPDRPKDSRRKTKVVKKTNSPSWEEEIVYKGIAKTQLPSIGVEVIVWDANRLGRYEFLGGCNLNSGSRSGYGMDANGTERTLWVEMMSKPNTVVEGSVPLRSTID